MLRIHPQLRPMMQAPPPTGCTGRAPPASPPATSPGDGGAGATLDERLIALLSGLSAPAKLNPTAKTKAAPPHTAAAVLPLRFVTAINFSFPSIDAPSDTNAPACIWNALVRPDGRAVQEAAANENRTDLGALAGAAEWRSRRRRRHHCAQRDHLSGHSGAWPAYEQYARTDRRSHGATVRRHGAGDRRRPGQPNLGPWCAHWVCRGHWDGDSPRAGLRTGLAAGTARCHIGRDVHCTRWSQWADDRAGGDRPADLGCRGMDQRSDCDPRVRGGHGARAALPLPAESA